MSHPGSRTPEYQVHAAFRAPRTVLSLVIGAAVVALLPLIPAVSDKLGVSVRHTGLALGTFVLFSLAAAFEFRRHGVSRRYWALAISETWSVAFAGLYLVWASGDPTSVFWLIFICIVIVNALESGRRRVEDAAFVVGPLLLSAAFLLRGDLGGAGITLLLGTIEVVAFFVFRQISGRLREAYAERDRLRAEVAELRLREERSRISRDLHDGLGAELSSLIWSARRLQRQTAGTPLEQEAATFVERLRDGVEELRGVVWALRPQARGFADVVRRLQVHCEGLAGTIPLRLEALPAEGGPQLDGPLALQLVRSAQELVHNAARHAGASQISITVAADTEALICTVEDDGAGLPDDRLALVEGGLANLKVRARVCGGELLHEPLERGTRWRLRLPLRGPPMVM